MSKTSHHRQFYIEFRSRPANIRRSIFAFLEIRIGHYVLEKNRKDPI